MIFLKYFNKVKEMHVLKQASWYAVGQIIAQILSFVGVIVTSRYLGPTNVGLASFVQNYLAVFATITAGIDFYFTWKIAKSEEKLKTLKEYIGHKFHVMVALCFTGILSAWYVLPVDVAQMATVMLAPMLLIAIGGFAQYAVTVQGANIITAGQILGATVSLFAKVVLVFIKAPLIAFIVVLSFDMVSAGVFIALFYYLNPIIRKGLKQYLFPSLLSTVKLMYTIRISLIAIAVWQLITRVDQLVLATITSAYMLGIYASAVKIALVPNFIAGAMYSALTTRVALFAGKEDSFSKKRIRQVLLVYLLVGTVIAFGILACAPFLVNILYGAQFAEAVPVLRVYALTIPGMFLLFHYLAVYGAQEKHGHQIFVFSIGLLINVILVYLLTPLFGLMGAALATVCTYTFLAGAFYFHVR